MISIAQAEEMITSLPDTTEGLRYGRRTWFVGGSQFAWVRPLTKADIRRLGNGPMPTGTIIGLAVENLAEKESVLQAGHPGIFTISHFDGYPAVLVQLDLVDEDVLRETILDAWLASAPVELAEAHATDLARWRDD